MAYCSGLCRRVYPAVKDGRRSYYLTGGKRCTHCNEWIKCEGKRCPCCQTLLRSKPRQMKWKNKMRAELAIDG